MNGKNLDSVSAIKQWSVERGLDKSNPDKQLIKLQEELGELAEGHNKGYMDQVKDSIGDMFVVMTIYCQQRGLSIDDCIDSAYQTIANRKGETVDGVFVKEADKQ